MPGFGYLLEPIPFLSDQFVQTHSQANQDESNRDERKPHFEEL